MSHVTDIILSTCIEDGALQDTEHPNVDQLNKYLFDNHNGAALVKIDQHAGGGKAMKCDIFIAAINYLNISSFLNAFYEIKWEAPDYVQLMLKDEHDIIFTIYVPKT